MPNELQNGEAEFALLRGCRWVLLGMTLYSAYLWQWGINPDALAIAAPLRRVANIAALTGFIVTVVAFCVSPRHEVGRKVKWTVAGQAASAIAVIGTVVAFLVF
jgi:hypothetical protein